jgi:phosphoglycolate phosphatase-like HAD superfamily hydrolase
MTTSATAVLFDLDGVIVDTRQAILGALAMVASSELRQEITPCELERYVTQPPPDVLAALGVLDPGTVYEQAFDAALAVAIGELQVFVSVVRGIEALVAGGVKVGVVTRQSQRRLPMLIPSELVDRLDVVVAHEHALPKPAPDGILLALKRLGVPPSRGMYVGDTPTDVQAARAAGVRSVVVAWGFTPEVELRSCEPDAVLTAPSQVGLGLLRLLEA